MILSFPNALRRPTSSSDGVSSYRRGSGETSMHLVALLISHKGYLASLQIVVLHMTWF